MIWIVWVIGVRIAKYGTEYDKYHDKLAEDIATLPMTEANYDSLMEQVRGLGQLKYRDKEKTCVLSAIFWRKYTEIRLKRLADNNFK